jgi:hypothetical protein
MKKKPLKEKLAKSSTRENKKTLAEFIKEGEETQYFAAAIRKNLDEKKGESKKD